MFLCSTKSNLIDMKDFCYNDYHRYYCYFIIIFVLVLVSYAVITVVTKEYNFPILTYMAANEIAKIVKMKAVYPFRRELTKSPLEVIRYYTI